MENWLFRKSRTRVTINEALIIGDGIGKPMGLLNANSGIRNCEVSPATPRREFIWQDLVSSKLELPMQWRAGASYLMDRKTAALLLTRSSCRRPQMPDVRPGSRRSSTGNCKQSYTIVHRKAVTMLVDPYSAGFSTTFKFEAPVSALRPHARTQRACCASDNLIASKRAYRPLRDSNTCGASAVRHVIAQWAPRLCPARGVNHAQAHCRGGNGDGATCRLTSRASRAALALLARYGSRGPLTPMPR
jgi:hypothetical protein